MCARSYVRALGALYMRLVGTAQDIYSYLEPLYYDYRRIKMRNMSGSVDISHMDEFIDELLHSERSCNVILPFLPKRWVLEDNGVLEKRVSILQEMADAEEAAAKALEAAEQEEREPRRKREVRNE